MAGRSGWLVAFLRRAEPREQAPSAWALAFDSVVAVGAAAGAVYEMANRFGSITVPAGSLKPPPGVAPIPPASIHALLVPIIGKSGDVTLAGVLPEHASLVVLIGAALTALPLAARRIYPIIAWLAIAFAIVAIHGTYVPPVALGTAVFAAYSAITHSRYRNLAIAMVVAVTFAVAGIIGPALPRFPGRLTAIFAIVPAAAAGVGIRELRRRLADSAARLRRAAADAEAATARALAAERARIASELHDVVTHNVSVMIVQAGAARKIMSSSAADAEDALLAVEATGREAMTELRNLLGLLSPAGDGSDGGGVAAAAASAGAVGAGAGGSGVGGAGAGGAGAGGAGAGGAGAGAGGAGAGVGGAVTRRPQPALHPQPGLGELDALVGRVSAAGLPVELQVSGSPWPLSPGADLAAYRVVQEGLTNVLRHAGPAAATVGVSWGDELVITVSDDGGGGGSSGAPGRGLLGLRERLALYGGELAAGPRAAGGWQVRAVLPAGTAS